MSCRSFRAGCCATAGSVATTASLAVGGHSADSLRSGGLERGVQQADGSKFVAQSGLLPDVAHRWFGVEDRLRLLVVPGQALQSPRN